MQLTIVNCVLLWAASAGFAIANSKVPRGAIVLPLTYNEFTAAYYAPFHIGTPPQLEYLKVDTGSPTLSFLDSRSSFCNGANQPCKVYGSFDNYTSSTCSYEGSNFFDELQDAGSGAYLNDTITLGGVATDHMYFGYINSYGNPSALLLPQATIAGEFHFALAGSDVSPRLNNLIVSLGFAENHPIGYGPYLLAQLKNASSINRKSVSVYLGGDTNSNGSLVLGAFYDKAKLASKPFAVKMVDPSSQSLALGETNFVNVTQIEVVVGENRTTFHPGPSPDVGQSTQLDTGNPEWLLPTPVFNAVTAGLGNPTQRIYKGARPLVVDCKYRSATYANGYVTTTFGNAGSLKVPLHSLVDKFSDGTCGTHLYEVGVSHGTAAFGAPWLRNVYAIFDQEALTVTLAQAKHTAQQDIVAFPHEGFKAGA